jgi:hypothetical protein
MAAPYIFTKIAKDARLAGFQPQQSYEAKRWFRSAAKQVQSVNVNRLMEGTPSRLQTRLTPNDIGHMFLFWYDPKHKDTLPYWDQCPLILPFHVERDHFKAFNLHYISPYRRAQVLDALYRVAIRENDRIRALRVSYGMLGEMARLAPLRSCVKMYLRSHIKSRFMWIRPEEYDTAVMLPTARFVGASPTKVQRDSARRF